MGATSQGLARRWPGWRARGRGHFPYACGPHVGPSGQRGRRVGAGLRLAPGKPRGPELPAWGRPRGHRVALPGVAPVANNKPPGSPPKRRSNAGAGAALTGLVGVLPAAARGRASQRRFPPPSSSLLPDPPAPPPSSPIPGLARPPPFSRSFSNRSSSGSRCPSADGSGRSGGWLSLGRRAAARAPPRLRSAQTQSSVTAGWRRPNRSVVTQAAAAARRPLPPRLCGALP